MSFVRATADWINFSSEMPLPYDTKSICAIHWSTLSSDSLVIAASNPSAMREQ